MTGYTLRHDGKLKNGATLIEQRGDVVLAKFRGEYVTWKIDAMGGCYWGHYHGQDITKAVAEFNERRSS